MSSNISISKARESENALVVVDTRFPARWLDAFGDVEKCIIDTWYRAADFVVTATGTSPITASIVPGAVALITSGGSDFDGDNVQAVGTRFKLEAGKPCYFGAKLTINEATQSDLLVGLCGLDTALTAASSAHAIDLGAGGIFFSKMDNTTTGYFKSYQTTAENNSAAALVMDTAEHVYEIFYDGSVAYGYVDGVLVGTFSTLLPTVVLTPSLAFRTGSAAAKTCTLHWMRAIQLRS